ncbi:MAG: methyltransferase family protein [bacterium]
MSMISHLYNTLVFIFQYVTHLITRDISTFINIPKSMVLGGYHFTIQNWSMVIPLLFFLVYIYWISLDEGKEWMKSYFIPITFFFIMFLRVLMNTLLGLRRELNPQSILELINSSFVIIFMGIVVFSYLIRSSPKKKAHGFLEGLYPLFVVVFHLIGSYVLATQTKINYVSSTYFVGLCLCVIGVTFNIAALWQLKNSFSIMVEVRKLVNTGVYRFLRHPLYTGEMTHLLGVCLLFNNPYAYSFFRVVLLMQLSRAKLEERKLSLNLPEYRIYKQNTGFIFPKFRTLLGKRGWRKRQEESVS